MKSEETGKTVAFFYISPNGYAVVRRPGDYISRMIRLAGGSYILPEEPGQDSALSTMNMEMESFYQAACDADFIIYNNTIDEGVFTVDDLLAKSPLLGGFRAVKEQNVWYTGKDMFQQPSGIADMILDIHKLLTGETEEQMRFLHKAQ